ncbi:hypothetical protein HRbin30_01519 [bacterium HR30]|nr:hypothetical protein HRbin30_01519 [bacterium HR30]
MRFIALPVGQGDAFYADSDDGFRVLVDGGRSRSQLPQLFRRYTGSCGVDVLVCTHNDADHAEGLIGFLESELLCSELWLPGTWLETLQSLPNDPGETISFLWDRLFKPLEKRSLPETQEGRDFQEIAWLYVFPEFIERRPIRDDTQAHEATEGHDALPLNAYLDENKIEALEAHLELFANPRFWYWWWAHRYSLSPSSIARAYFTVFARAYFTVAKDVRRLLELARLALNRGIPVRCFQHDPLNVGNVTVFPGCPLRPLSAKPSRYVRPPKPANMPVQFFEVLFRTTANRESLVFFLDAGKGEPGVLFTADSDLKDVNVKHVPERSVATAPHHGSHDNRSAYSRINKPMVWVRSDGYSKNRPCREFLHAPDRRFCTLCPKSGKPKQAVRLYQRQGLWVRLRTRPCACR